MSTVKWSLDTAHSELNFKVKHLMISNVKGSFKDFSVEILGEDFATSKVNAQVKTISIFTNNEDRDNHLRSADFFDVENFPEMKFEGTSLTKKSDDEFTLVGNLTIKDVTKEVALAVDFGGVSKDPWGNEKLGFSVKGKINRKDFGLNWNAALETGGVLVSEEVKIEGELQFAKQN
ncbi:conserved hypothetical protein [Capnocytophaga canimorsus]|nr:YceI family protein [Capnocytophaga canimorsus]CEN49261.1 conserved hypothetical protein [Capnocytophaga canimorsus]